MKRKGRGKVTPEIIERMKKLRKEGLLYGKIADKLKLSKMTVYNYLKKGDKVGTIGRLNGEWSRRLLRSIIGWTFCIILGILGAFIIFSDSPSSVSSKTAAEIFRVIAEVDGVLIGFTGIIGIFILRESPKKLFSSMGLFLVILALIFSICNSLAGMMVANSASIPLKDIILSVGFLVGGILYLFVLLDLAFKR